MNWSSNVSRGARISKTSEKLSGIKKSICRSELLNVNLRSRPNNYRPQGEGNVFTGVFSVHNWPHDYLFTARPCSVIHPTGMLSCLTSVSIKSITISSSQFNIWWEKSPHERTVPMYGNCRWKFIHPLTNGLHFFLSPQRWNANHFCWKIQSIYVWRYHFFYRRVSIIYGVNLDSFPAVVSC